MKTVELIDMFAKAEGPLVSQILVNVLGDLPLIQARLVLLNRIRICIHTFNLSHKLVFFFFLGGRCCISEQRTSSNNRRTHRSNGGGQETSSGSELLNDSRLANCKQEGCKLPGNEERLLS